MKAFLQKYGVLIAALLGYTFLFALTCNDPFYGDSKSTISRLSTQIYYTNFQTVFYPKGIDPGHPILFPVFHALLWKVIGPHLWVSHIINFLFSILLLLAAYLLDKRHSLKGIFIALIALNPITISLAAGLNTHIVLAACTLWYVHFYLNKNTLGMLLCAALMLLTHNEGLLIFIAFLAAQFIIERKIVKILPLLLAFSPWLAWLLIHKHYTGWFLFPPEYANFRGTGTPMTLLKNAGIIVWRLLDFGLLTITLLGSYFCIKNRNKDTYFFAIFSVLMILAIWMTVKFAIAHRYFIPVFLLLSIPTAYYLLNKKKIIVGSVFIILLSGSFWYYPGKQLSDPNILYRNYYKIYAQIQQSDFSNYDLYSTAPNENVSLITHIAPHRYKNLLKIKNASDCQNVLEIDCVMEGNLNGPLPDSIKILIADWPYQTFESGVAYLNVYVKPSAAVEIKSNWQHRTPSQLEKWMKAQKEKLKP